MFRSASVGADWMVPLQEPEIRVLHSGSASLRYALSDHVVGSDCGGRLVRRFGFYGT
jgi:hypothetical protein